MLKSAGTVSLARQHHPQFNLRAPIPGLEPNSFKQFSPCTGKISLLGQESSPDFMTRCGAGIGLNRQFGLFLSVGRPIRIGKHARIVHPGFCIVGLQPQTLFHLETRFRDLALRRQCAAEIQSPLGDAGLYPERGSEFLLRSGPVTQHPTG